MQEADLQLQQLIAAAEDAGVDMGGHGSGGGSRQPYTRTPQQDNLEYEEFRQPDVNGDNVISKLEVRVCACVDRSLPPSVSADDGMDFDWPLLM